MAEEVEPSSLAEEAPLQLAEEAVVAASQRVHSDHLDCQAKRCVEGVVHWCER